MLATPHDPTPSQWQYLLSHLPFLFLVPSTFLVLGGFPSFAEFIYTFKIKFHSAFLNVYGRSASI